ncbi:MAG TPA: hypothetical protein VMR62_00855, partial [Bryobacteraceae bacterium]|nr:hypothetical protein [Bryobacteraceae bacterium]
MRDSSYYAAVFLGLPSVVVFMGTENQQRYPGSLVSPEAKIGQNVRIGFACHIYPWAEIGDGSVVPP